VVAALVRADLVGRFRIQLSLHRSTLRLSAPILYY
jgi:hypothetical protein